MDLNILLLILSATWAASAAPIPEFQQSRESLVACVRLLDSVAGKACGPLAEPGEFFLLSQIVMASGTEEQFRELLGESHAVSRCMGLLALAQMGGRENGRTIQSYLTDRGLIEYRPGGCSTETITVGAFAAILLFTNGRVLGHSGPLLPLISEEERVSLDLEILARDAAAVPLPKRSRTLEREIQGGTVPLQLADLRRSAPSLQEFEIIKGIGRLPRSPRQRDFLIACVDSNSLDDKSRLAAASALTRHTDDGAVQALHRNREALNRLGERPWGDEFIETSDAMKAHEENIRVFKGFRFFRKRPKEAVIAALTNTHPLALSTLNEHRPAGYARDNRDIRQAWADSMVAISRRAGDLMQPWNTYAHTVFELGFFIQYVRSRPSHWATRESGFIDGENGLTVEEYSEFERNVTEALNRPLPAK